MPTDVAYATSLPGDSAKRKEYPILSGLLKYFPAALAGVARHSWMGNQKHNKGEPIHHARGKSMDHGDCIPRHLMDLADLLAAKERGQQTVRNYINVLGEVVDEIGIDLVILDEVNALCWRSLAYAQDLHERIGGAPLAPGAKV